jgi:hypothetical protein
MDLGHEKNILFYVQDQGSDFFTPSLLIPLYERAGILLTIAQSYT